MIESILMYGAEIWGWKEQEEVETTAKFEDKMDGREECRILTAC
jgi:hypothetical protein